MLVLPRLRIVLTIKLASLQTTVAEKHAQDNSTTKLKFLNFFSIFWCLTIQSKIVCIVYYFTLFLSNKNCCFWQQWLMVQKLPLTRITNKNNILSKSSKFILSNNKFFGNFFCLSAKMRKDNKQGELTWYQIG